MALLELINLSVSYPAPAGVVRAVRGVSLRIDAGESLALVGETASGKSTVALALIGLLAGNARVELGEIRFEGVPLSLHDRHSWRQVRGKKIGMVFQDARGALNPVLTVGAQLVDALRAHQQLPIGPAREKAAGLLAEAGIPDPEFFMRRYPGELSGGMCQRVAIAIAVCNQPRLLIADEPTSALDPSIQAQILELLRKMKDRHGLALLLISHDLALVSEVSEAVAVMYHGRMIEFGRAQDIFQRPAHPYTSSLMECQADFQHRWDRRPLAAIAGSPPTAGQESTGCAFAPRCPKADAGCTRNVPPATTISAGHWAACFKPN
jgi:oligopeptide/dipeptide ABC transporter ATP-binding protein